MMLTVMVMIMAMSLNVQMLNIDLGKVGIASGTGEWNMRHTSSSFWSLKTPFATFVSVRPKTSIVIVIHDS